MRVGVQRKPCRKMPQHARHGLDVHAVLQGHGREGVAEVVKADAGQPRPFQHGGGREHPLAVARFSSLLHQNVYRIRRQRQCAVGVFRFQRCFDHLAVLP